MFSLIYIYGTGLSKYSPEDLFSIFNTDNSEDWTVSSSTTEEIDIRDKEIYFAHPGEPDWEKFYKKVSEFIPEATKMLLTSENDDKIPYIVEHQEKFYDSNDKLQIKLSYDVNIDFYVWLRNKEDRMAIYGDEELSNLKINPSVDYLKRCIEEDKKMYGPNSNSAYGQVELNIKDCIRDSTSLLEIC